MCVAINYYTIIVGVTVGPLICYKSYIKCTYSHHEVTNSCSFVVKNHGVQNKFKHIYLNNGDLNSAIYKNIKWSSQSSEVAHNNLMWICNGVGVSELNW